jgi:hypothetical protein
MSKYKNEDANDASQLEEPQRIRCISITNRDQSRKSSPRLNEKVCHCPCGSPVTHPKLPHP